MLQFGSGRPSSPRPALGMPRSPENLRHDLRRPRARGAIARFIHRVSVARSRTKLLGVSDHKFDDRSVCVPKPWSLCVPHTMPFPAKSQNLPGRWGLPAHRPVSGEERASERRRPVKGNASAGSVWPSGRLEETCRSRSLSGFCRRGPSTRAAFSAVVSPSVDVNAMISSVGSIACRPSSAGSISEGTGQNSLGIYLEESAARLDVLSDEAAASLTSRPHALVSSPTSVLASALSLPKSMPKGADVAVVCEARVGHLQAVRHCLRRPRNMSQKNGSSMVMLKEAKSLESVRRRRRLARRHARSGVGGCMGDCLACPPAPCCLKQRMGCKTSLGRGLFLRDALPVIRRVCAGPPVHFTHPPRCTAGVARPQRVPKRGARGAADPHLQPHRRQNGWPWGRRRQRQRRGRPREPLLALRRQRPRLPKRALRHGRGGSAQAGSERSTQNAGSTGGGYTSALRRIHLNRFRDRPYLDCQTSTVSMPTAALAWQAG